MNPLGKRYKLSSPPVPDSALCVGVPGAPICAGCRRFSPGPRGPKHMTYAPASSETVCFYRPKEA